MKTARDWRVSASEPNIIHADSLAVIDVRPAAWRTDDDQYEVCVGKAGATISWRVGFGNLESCTATANKLAKHPKQALAFAGIA